MGTGCSAVAGHCKFRGYKVLDWPLLNYPRRHGIVPDASSGFQIHYRRTQDRAGRAPGEAAVEAERVIPPLQAHNARWGHALLRAAAGLLSRSALFLRPALRSRARSLLASGAVGLLPALLFGPALRVCACSFLTRRFVARSLLPLDLFVRLSLARCPLRHLDILRALEIKARPEQRDDRSHDCTDDRRRALPLRNRRRGIGPPGGACRCAAVARPPAGCEALRQASHPPARAASPRLRSTDRRESIGDRSGRLASPPDRLPVVAETRAGCAPLP